MARAHPHSRPPARRRGSPHRRSSARSYATAGRRHPRQHRSRPTNPRIIWLVAAGLIVLLTIEPLANRPGLAVTILVVLCVGALAVAGANLRLAASRRRREEDLTRSIAGVDVLSGPQFEHFVATLMRRTGFTDVRVCGGAGDLGADITALIPTGQLVVQCKRYQLGRGVGSPDVQRFAGTARELHGAAVAAIITTSHFTKPAVDVAARLGIALVDREALARWAADDQPPSALSMPVRPNAGSRPGAFR